MHETAQQIVLLCDPKDYLWKLLQSEGGCLELLLFQQGRLQDMTAGHERYQQCALFRKLQSCKPVMLLIV
jgi:hypothetical protein